MSDYDRMRGKPTADEEIHVREATRSPQRRLDRAELLSRSSDGAGSLSNVHRKGLLTQSRGARYRAWLTRVK